MSTLRVKSIIAGLLVLLGSIYFFLRGPYRAIAVLNSYDFASVYGATRAWVHGENPYDMQAVLAARRDGGNDPRSFPTPSSVYLPTALPIVTPIASLPWIQARFVWCLLSCAAFALSLQLLFRTVSMTHSEKWSLAGLVLLFSPTSSGLSTGNPGVLSCGLILWGLDLAWAESPWLAALAIGLAHCLKPQLSIGALAVLLCWRMWRISFLSLIPPMLSAIVSFLPAASPARYGHWLITLRQGIAESVAPGGLNDPTPSNIYSINVINLQTVFGAWSDNRMLYDSLSWLTAALLLGAYLWFRRRVTDNRRWLDLAFFSTWTLTFVYHRYYDAQTLLAVIPWLVVNRKTITAKAVAFGLLLFLLPLQVIFASVLQKVDVSSIPGFLLFRHEPVALAVMCTLMVASAARFTERA